MSLKKIFEKLLTWSIQWSSRYFDLVQCIKAKVRGWLLRSLASFGYGLKSKVWSTGGLIRTATMQCEHGLAHGSLIPQPPSKCKSAQHRQNVHLHFLPTTGRLSSMEVWAAPSAQAKALFTRFFFLWLVLYREQRKISSIYTKTKALALHFKGVFWDEKVFGRPKPSRFAPSTP